MNSSQMIDKVVQGVEPAEVLLEFDEGLKDALSSIKSTARSIQVDLRKKFKIREVKAFLVEVNRRLSKVSKPTIKVILDIIKGVALGIATGGLALLIVDPIRTLKLTSWAILQVLKFIASSYGLKSVIAPGVKQLGPATV